MSNLPSFCFSPTPWGGRKHCYFQFPVFRFARHRGVAVSRFPRFSRGHSVGKSGKSANLDVAVRWPPRGVGKVGENGQSRKKSVFWPPRVLRGRRQSR
eukprot:1701329-Lingulodinium_polyedra.AAC.1